jgi:hypothetical protein
MTDGSIFRFAIPSQMRSGAFWDHLSRIKGHEYDDNSLSLNVHVWSAWNVTLTHSFRRYYVGVGRGACVRLTWPADCRRPPWLPVPSHLDQGSAKLWTKALTANEFHSQLSTSQSHPNAANKQRVYPICIPKRKGIIYASLALKYIYKKGRCYWKFLGYIWNDFQDYTLLMYEAIKL